MNIFQKRTVGIIRKLYKKYVAMNFIGNFYWKYSIFEQYKIDFIRIDLILRQTHDVFLMKKEITDILFISKIIKKLIKNFVLNMYIKTKVKIKGQ